MVGKIEWDSYKKKSYWESNSKKSGKVNMLRFKITVKKREKGKLKDIGTKFSVGH